MFKYNADAGTLDKYEYGTNNISTIVSFSNVTHEVGDIQILIRSGYQFIVIGIPHLMKVQIVNYNSSQPINLNNELKNKPNQSLYIDSPLSFYTGFGKQIDITDNTISISCDNYVHIYEVVTWDPVKTSRYVTIDPSYDETNIPFGLNDITFSDDGGTEIKSFKYIQ